VPQIARISSGSSEGAAGAERSGADEDGGRERWVLSEFRLSSFSRLTRFALRETEGVRDREEWMSPRRFLGGVVTAAGLLYFLV
jgi:hypothetical protein